MNTRLNEKPFMQGAMTALVTPFRDGAIDWSTIDELVDHQIESGIRWIVVCGTTGESPTLSSEEKRKLLEHILARVSNQTHLAAGEAGGAVTRCRIMAGTGSNSTAETVRKTREARDLGADAAMLVAPYYNRPPQEGLFRHYAAVAEAVELPLVLYNVPGRTGVHVTNDVVVRLKQRYPHIVAIKDATGTVENAAALKARCSISVLCGDDVLAWPMMAAGASGVISVVSNLVPHLVSSLVRSALAGDTYAARADYSRVYDLASGLAAFGPNPIPIKTAMAIHGWIEEELRLPLCPVSTDARAAIARLLQQHEIPQPVHA